MAGLTIAFLQAGCAGTGNSSVAASLQQTIRADPNSRGDIANVSALRSTMPAMPTLPASIRALASSTGANCGLDDFESSLLTRINQYRAAGANCHTAGQFAAARPLVWNALLQQAASGHAQDMAVSQYLSHTSLDGRSMFDRINATGYAWRTLGENIAATAPTVNAVVAGWMASDAHCANLMKAALQDVALACVASTAGKYEAYWAMNTGAPR